MKSINALVTSVIKRDLARAKKSFKCYIIPLPRLSYCNCLTKRVQLNILEEQILLYWS